eukprot:CAMPEP_0172427004 /NCGR_PEP_ID=MMETSP1064-20121228/40133_1 /TAXON_ID=202472 /ORGANISM="Aulacoseira subarctica , Strain CCAP 1002/5" /LENGTH=244 /DNA_ID=CAMNT_0013170957 /DNA_START=89 /DNA_END=823 /DNA_ORIENTATION=+
MGDCNFGMTDDPCLRRRGAFQVGDPNVSMCPRRPSVHSAELCSPNGSNDQASSSNISRRTLMPESVLSMDCGTSKKKNSVQTQRNSCDIRADEDERHVNNDRGHLDLLQIAATSLRQIPMAPSFIEYSRPSEQEQCAQIISRARHVLAVDRRICDAAVRDRALKQHVEKIVIQNERKRRLSEIRNRTLLNEQVEQMIRKHQDQNRRIKMLSRTVLNMEVEQMMRKHSLRSNGNVYNLQANVYTR